MINTLYWAMLDQLKNKRSVFADVIQDHFRLKRYTIAQQMEKWTTILSRCSRFSKMKNDLSEQIRMLPDPSTLPIACEASSSSGSTSRANPQKRSLSAVDCCDLTALDDD